MTAPFDELRSEIAQRHQVLVGPDDPILILVTANDFCVQRSLQLLESAHAQALALQSQQLELAAQRWLVAAQLASQQALARGCTDIQAAAATAARATQATVDQSVRALIRPLHIAIGASICGSLLSLVACALLWLR